MALREPPVSSQIQSAKISILRVHFNFLASINVKSTFAHHIKLVTPENSA